MLNSEQTLTIKRGELMFVVRTEVDECPDLSWLGKYTDECGTYRFDRKEGVLLGAWSRIRRQLISKRSLKT